MKTDPSQCATPCQGILADVKKILNSGPRVDKNLKTFLQEYDDYKRRDTDNIKKLGTRPGNTCHKISVPETHLTSVPESDTKLEFVRIYFDTSMFDKITKEILNLTDKLNSIVDLRTRQQNLWINSLLSEGRWAYSQDFL